MCGPERFDTVLCGPQLRRSVSEKIVFVLSGNGEQRDELIELAADLGIHSDKVIFTGFVREAMA